MPDPRRRDGRARLERALGTPGRRFRQRGTARARAAKTAALLAGAAWAAYALPATSPPVPAARAVPGGGGSGTSWTVYHGDPLGTGVARLASGLLPLRLAWRSPPLDGQLYGEPLASAGRVLVATERDTVYALAASTGRILWMRHLGAPVPSRDLPCGDIAPDVGITGTPVVDPARHEVFVVADELRRGLATSHHLVGIDLYDGRVELDEAVDPPRSDPSALLQRPGLALDRGQVLIAFGGNYGDCGNYHGTIAAVPEVGGRPRYYLVDAAAGERQGAVWMGGAAPLVDPEGNVWFAAGNGSQSGPPYDGSDSVTELSSSLRLEQLFAPSTWPQDNRSDLDLGSTAPAFVGAYVFQVGKRHVAYLLSRSHLGGIGHPLVSMPLCEQDPHGGSAVLGSTVYLACGEGVTAVRTSSRPPRISLLWTTPPGPSGAPVDGPPIIAAGLVWSLDTDGTLWGLSPANGHHVVEEQTHAGEANHFPTPAVAEGLLLAPTTDRVFAYSGPAGPPPAPVDRRSGSRRQAGVAPGRRWRQRATAR